MALGLLRDGLVTQLSHAAYLGEELAKAQTALQFGLRYDQDRPLRSREPQTPSPSGIIATPVQNAPPAPPPLPMTLEQLDAREQGSKVDVVLSITKISQEHQFSGIFLKMDDAELFTAYHLTDRQVEVQWSEATKMIMGEAKEVVEGARVRVGGKLQNNRSVSAEHIIILTRVTKIIS